MKRLKIKNKKFYIILIVLIAVYACFLAFDDFIDGRNNVPVIEVPSDVLTISVKDDEKKLMEGIKAHDNEDGDLSDEIFIENISQFNDIQERTVTYTVIDKDNSVARASRQIRYSDYEKPELYIKIPLVISYYESVEEPEAYVGADSCIDGDLSERVTIDRYYDEEKNHYVTYSVTDSCGTKVSEDFKLTELNQNPNINIYLDKYFIKVPVGTEINPASYIKKTEENGIENTSDFSDVTIKSNYNKSEAGMYEFIYEINKFNGSFGITKLVVIAE